MSALTRLAAVSPSLLRGGAVGNLPLADRAGELVLHTLAGLINWPRRLRLGRIWSNWLWRLGFGRFNLLGETVVIVLLSGTGQDDKDE